MIARTEPSPQSESWGRESDAAAVWPNLFVLGAPKAGTTTIYHLLKRHPSICMAEEKEPRTLELAAEVDAHTYRDYFRHRDGEPYVGEASPTYLFAPWAHRRIADHAPDAHLVAILRDPVERAYSDWWMYYSKGLETRPFEEAIRENLDALDDGRSFEGPEGRQRWTSIVDGIEHDRRIEEAFFVDMGHYAEQITHLVDTVGDPVLKVLLLEDVRENPGEVTRELFGFLGLDADEIEGRVGRSNEGLGQASTLGLPLLRLIQRTGIVRYIPEGLKSLGRELLRRGPERPPMSPEARRRLGRHYQDHDRRLADLLGRPLPWRADS